MPVNDEGLEYTSIKPTRKDELTQGDSEYTPNSNSYSLDPDWNKIDIWSSGDAIQVRNPDGSYHHGISFGEDKNINGGKDDLKVLDKKSFYQKVIYFDAGNPKDKDNYDYGFAWLNQTDETPGYANTDANLNMINTLACNDNGGGGTIGQSGGGSGEVDNSGGDGGETSGKTYTEEPDEHIKVYPNPFNKSLNIELDFTDVDSKPESISIALFDLTGRKVLSIANEEPVKSNSLSFLGIAQNLPAGVYMCHINYMENQKTYKSRYIKVIKL